jgi:FtsP/CotA-like multicopper oxidase with cupredoxin domain
MKPLEKQFWRVINASADTILDIQLQCDGTPQPLQVVALDGVPTGSQDGTARGKTVTETDIFLAPAARAEFIVTSPAPTVQNAMLLTLNIDTGPDGDNDPHGQTPALFNRNNPPAIITTQGAVEDWTIENRAMENHEFHMHQIHFPLLAQNGVRVRNGQYLDMIQVPYWTGTGPYPSVTVRMDFRGPDVGDFVYHCHILGHEDSGMMAIIRVIPRSAQQD